MSVVHVEKIKREMILIRSAYQIGRLDARTRPNPSKDLERWSPATRTAYLLGKIVEDPDTVSDEDMSFLDLGLMNDLTIPHADR